jgi:hypothetical protein
LEANWYQILMELPTSLPSWNETPSKQAILDFAAAVTNENGPDYVLPAIKRVD